MKFEIGVFTDITEIYKKYTSSLQDGDGYIKFFICLDVKDIWLIRVIEGLNEEYSKEDGKFLLERNNIPKDFKSQNLTLSKVIEIIKNDDFSNWDVNEYDDLDLLIEDIDGGFGLN